MVSERSPIARPYLALAPLRWSEPISRTLSAWLSFGGRCVPSSALTSSWVMLPCSFRYVPYATRLVPTSTTARPTATQPSTRQTVPRFGPSSRGSPYSEYS